MLTTMPLHSVTAVVTSTPRALSSVVVAVATGVGGSGGGYR